MVGYGTGKSIMKGYEEVIIVFVSELESKVQSYEKEINAFSQSIL